MPVPHDADRPAVDREHVEGRLGRSLQHGAQLARIRVRTEARRGEDVAQQPEGARSGKRADQRHGQDLRRQAQGTGDRREHLGQRVHRAGAAESADGGEDRHQERDDADGDVEALLGALHERLVHLHALDPAMERDPDQQSDQDPARGDLDGVPHFHTLSSSLAETMATASAQNVAASVGTRMPAGSADRADARRAITVVGTS